MKHWLSMLESRGEALRSLVSRAGEIKGGSATNALRGKVMTALYFNPSLRTRASFESGLARFGGHCVSLSPGSDTWAFEWREGTVMDGREAEHLAEAVRVLCRYSDCLGVRSFAGLRDAAEDAREEVLRAFVKYASVPVVNLESATEHPCQALADMLTIAEKLDAPRGRHFVLRWAPHIKPLPLAVPHSAALAAATLGMRVTIVHPEGYELAPNVMARVRELCEESGSECQVAHEYRDADSSAEVLYVKSWGSPSLYGKSDAQTEDFTRLAGWRVDCLNSEVLLMHCLPVRRNVVIADAVLDSAQSIVIDQAENRLWAQVAILEHLLS